MHSFCSKCGEKISSDDLFCGACGSPISSKCPTCGQLWDGKASSSSSPLIDTKPSKKFAKVESKKEIVSPAPLRVNSRLTSAGIDPVYGSAFNPKFDCSNCGAKDERVGVCRICGQSG
jgi:predicted amidophosphoribosyltransferase